ncbi:unnamed protein product [Fasciola hepatica]|uniref:Spectrin repeat-containing domain protein n=1 Tax=Fasciola hepatica TaxID=6192 RepID=A0ABC9HH02_FASHE
MHTQRIQQVFQDVVNTIVQHPNLSDRLKIKLSEITSDWDELRRRIRDRIACMVQMHRAIIFQDGYLRLDLWLKTFAEKLGLVEAMNLADTIELSCTPTVTGLTVAEPDGTDLLTPCDSFHSVNVQLQTMNTQLEESKTKEKLLDELKAFQCELLNTRSDPFVRLNNILEIVQGAVEQSPTSSYRVTCEHAAILKQTSPTTTMKVDQVPDLNTLEKRYWLIRHTVEKRWAQIDAQKHYHRLLFDLGDEQIWIRERIYVANNQDVGRSLLAVNHLIRRHRLMLKEVAVRDAHVESLLKEADSILIQWQTRAAGSTTSRDLTNGSDQILLHPNGIKFRLRTQVLHDLTMCEISMLTQCNFSINHVNNQIN